MKKNIIIVILVIVVLCLGGYLVYDKVISNENNNIVDQEKSNNISSIKISKPCDDCTDPEYEEKTINDTNEINSILEELEKVTFVDKVPDGIGFGFPLTIEVSYKDSKVDTYLFLSSDKLVIRYSGDDSYSEYELTNKNFKNELIQRYFSN